MKKFNISALLVILVLPGVISCQMAKKNERQPVTNNQLEVTLSGLKGNTSEQAWNLSVKNNVLYFSQITGNQQSAQRHIKLDEDEVNRLSDVLNDCKFRKIKTKRVSKNRDKPRLRLYIQHAGYEINSAETSEIRFTKKSRKKIRKIYRYLVNLVQSNDIDMSTDQWYAESGS